MWSYSDVWVESTPRRIVRIDGNYVELQNSAAFTALDEKYTLPNHHIHDAAGFFGILNEETLPTDFNYTMRPISGCMLRAYSTRTMRKWESITREEGTLHMSFPDLSTSEIFIPQQEAGTEYNYISRETTITLAQWKTKVATGEWFICAEPKVVCDADNDICELRVKKTPCKSQSAALAKRSFKRLATPLQPPRTPLACLLRKSPKYGYFPNLTSFFQNQISRYSGGVRLLSEKRLRK